MIEYIFAMRVRYCAAYINNIYIYIYVYYSYLSFS